MDRSVIDTGLAIVAGMIMVASTPRSYVGLDPFSTELDAALSIIEWVLTGYMLAVAMVIPITGWAIDRFDTKPWIVKWSTAGSWSRNPK